MRLYRRSVCPQSARRSTRLILCLLTMAGALLACSGSGDDAAEDSEESQSEDIGLRKALESPILEWASAATSAYLQQLDSGASLDHTIVLREVAPATLRLNKSVCEALRKDNRATKPASASDLQQDLSVLLDETIARAFALKPQLLVGLGMTTWGQWPPFMLKEPNPAPESEVGDISESISAFVKPEFLTSEQGLSIPSTEAVSYDDFQLWFFDPSLDNKLLERASITSQAVKAEGRNCLSEFGSG